MCESFPIPTANGIHAWIMTAAWYCRKSGLTTSEAVAKIEAYDGTLRRRLRNNEVSSAVEKVYQSTVEPGIRIPKPPELPSWNREETARIHQASGITVVDITVLSPLADPQMIPTREILATLFPDADGLLCVGKSAYEFQTAPLRDHKDLLHSQFVVPCYMTAPTGITQDGKTSAHCKANTGTRRYIVCDFDEPPPDQHAAIIEHLSKFRPLAMALSSGGKSLHAWFPVTESENDDRLFWRLCIALGADPTLYRNHSQFVRIPNGTRDSGKRQYCIYLNPQAVIQ